MMGTALQFKEGGSRRQDQISSFDANQSVAMRWHSLFESSPDPMVKFFYRRRQIIMNKLIASILLTVVGLSATCLLVEAGQRRSAPHVKPAFLRSPNQQGSRIRSSPLRPMSVPPQNSPSQGETIEICTESIPPICHNVTVPP